MEALFLYLYYINVLVWPVLFLAWVFWIFGLTDDQR